MFNLILVLLRKILLIITQCALYFNSSIEISQEIQNIADKQDIFITNYFFTIVKLMF